MRRRRELAASAGQDRGQLAQGRALTPVDRATPTRPGSRSLRLTEKRCRPSRKRRRQRPSSTTVVEGVDQRPKGTHQRSDVPGDQTTYARRELGRMRLIASTPALSATDVLSPKRLLRRRSVGSEHATTILGGRLRVEGGTHVRGLSSGPSEHSARSDIS